MAPQTINGVCVCCVDLLLESAGCKYMVYCMCRLTSKYMFMM